MAPWENENVCISSGIMEFGGHDQIYGKNIDPVT